MPIFSRTAAPEVGTSVGRESSLENSQITTGMPSSHRSGWRPGLAAAIGGENPFIPMLGRVRAATPLRALEFFGGGASSGVGSGDRAVTIEDWCPIHAVKLLMSLNRNPNVVVYRLAHPASDAAAGASPALGTALEAGWEALDEAEDGRSDWRGYLAVRRFLQQRKLEKNTYYGFLSADFGRRTGLTAEQVRAQVAACVAAGKGGIDAILWSTPSSSASAFVNTLEEAEYYAPGLTECALTLYGELLAGTSIPHLAMDAAQSVVGGFFVARPPFWRQWLAINEKIFAAAENSALAGRLQQAVEVAPGQAPVHAKVLLIERTASLMLATQPGWQVGVCRMTPPPLPLPSRLPLPAVGVAEATVLDALKAAYRERRQPEYLAAYLAARKRFFTGRAAPYDLESLLPSELKTGDWAQFQLPLREVVSYGALPGIHSTAQVAAMPLVDVMTAADSLTAQRQLPAAVRLYSDWIKYANSPLSFIARFNLGRILSDLGELSESLAVYQLALQQNPRFVQAYLNLGSVQERLGQQDEAIATWRKALEVVDASESPDAALAIHALNNLGRVLEGKHRYAEAEAYLTRSLALQSDQEQVLHHWVHLRQKQCAWPVYSPLPGITVETMVRSTSALAQLSASNDPELQLQTALSYAKSKVRSDCAPLAPAQGYAHDRIRLGYLSSNLNMHAVTILTAELFELHDRDRFEVTAFCWSPEDNTPTRARVVAALDALVRIDGMSDEAAAAAIRAAEIDILVDLHGLTAGCRPNILAQRPAPVQMTYIGFPGTTGLPGVDYVLADRYIIPEASARYFSEKPLYMPNCFQVNDRKRIAAPLPTREKYALPGDAFVFCAFNHNHKFSPEMFATWMRILQRTPGSVLWLLADNETARGNLIRYAADGGVGSERLIFGPRVPPMEYLARFQLADLFLDTLPFNGGTTASDALWMDLPLLTCSGRTFASRMAGSLLSAIGLPELITTSLADYEALAVSLWADRPRLGALRQRLAANKSTYPLFDTPRFVKDYENLLETVVKRPAPLR